MAQEPVGSVASLEGSAEIRHAGTWSDASLGSAIYLGDAVRTGQPGRVRLVFQDESVLNMGDESHLVIDKSVFDPGSGSFQSLVRLLRGKVRAVVSDYYQTSGASYEIETRTTVAGVRGTEFIMDYDPRLRVAQVVGISGRVEVRSLLASKARGVYVHSGEVSTVLSGREPTAPRPMDERLYRRHLDELEFVGLGMAEGFTAQHGVLQGISVPEPDRAEGATSTGPGSLADETRTRPDRTAGFLIDEPGLLDTSAAGLRVRF
jgi:hypothetical protein